MPEFTPEQKHIICSELGRRMCEIQNLFDRNNENPYLIDCKSWEHELQKIRDIMILISGEES
jgi:hypothetical protein